MKKTLPLALLATLVIALIISLSWTNKHASTGTMVGKETFAQFVTWVPKLENPWWTKDQCLKEYLSDPRETDKDPLMYNCTVYSTREEGNKLLAYKKPDSAWVVVDAPAAVDYLARLLYREHQKKDAPAVVDSLMKLLNKERQKNN